MLGVVNEFPLPKEVPPVAAAYQFSVVPAEPVAPKVTVPVPQRVAGAVVAMAGLLTTI